jgi:hypothetical protein
MSPSIIFMLWFGYFSRLLLVSTAFANARGEGGENSLSYSPTQWFTSRSPALVYQHRANKSTTVFTLKVYQGSHRRNLVSRGWGGGGVEVGGAKGNGSSWRLRRQPACFVSRGV